MSNLSRFLHPRPRVSRLARRRRKKYFSYAALCISAAAAFVALLGVLSYDHDAAVKKIVVTGNALVPARSIAAEVSQILSGSYAHLFAKRNTLILPRGEIVSNLKTSFPALASLSVTSVFPSTLVLAVKERTPASLWCHEEFRDESGASCFFMDSEGMIFAPAPDFSNDERFRFIGGLATTSVLGSRLFEADQFKEITFFLQSLRGLDLKPVSLRVEAQDYDSDFLIDLEGGTRLRVSGTKGLQASLDNIIVFFSDAEIASDKTFLSRVSYIDFKFGSNIYYRER